MTLKLVKIIPAYKDKSRLQGDKLVIDGIYYMVKDLPHLSSNLAPLRQHNAQITIH